ncbi:MAG: PKD-like domain-containing protein [Bacteroidia bacterium]
MKKSYSTLQRFNISPCQDGQPINGIVLNNTFRKKLYFSVLASIFVFSGLFSQITTVTISTAGTNTWTAPCGVTSVTVECWGGGGGGGNSNNTTTNGGSGGGGGAYAKGSHTVTAGNTYYCNIGSGGTGAPVTSTTSATAGTSTWFNATGSNASPASNTIGTLGTFGTGGVNNSTATPANGGAAASCFGNIATASGSNGVAGSGTGGGAGGAGAAPNGGAGGAGSTTADGANGTVPGGGGGGSNDNGANKGGNGGSGQVVITYNSVSPTITLGTNPTVIQGSTSANLPYTATTNSPNQYSITWNTAAQTAGFTNVSATTLTASPIVLTVPAGAAVDTYSGTVTVINTTTGCTGSSSFTVAVAYPIVEAFTNQVFCATTYTTPPSSYNTLNFSLIESSPAEFDASQTAQTIILTLPAGFQFNTGAPGTVRTNTLVTRDITALGLVSLTSTVLTASVTTAGTQANIDQINFENFQIGATTSGASGDLTRTGGTFKILGSAAIPSSTVSFGHLATSGPSTVTASAVNQYTTSTTVVKGCTTIPTPILEFKVTLNGGSCTPNDVLTQFIFSTTGSTNAATDISKATVYFSDTTQGFSYSNYFGSVNTPSGTFTVTGSQTLNKGNGPYYFYLAYTVPATATTGDVLDGTMSSFIFNGTTYTVSGNPAGATTITTGTCVSTPDIAPPTANTQTLTAGSLIIPMDNTHQLSGGLFNLKSYGLVHALLNSDIPVKWIIKSGKAKDAADFTTNVTSYAPISSTVSTAESFTASVFAVDSYYVSHAYYSGGQTAAQVISSYTSSVQVYKVVTDVAVDVRYTLNHRPKIAIFSNGGYQNVQVAYMTAAGITNYFVQDAGDFTGLAECYTFCSEAHWDYANNPDVRPVQRVVDFVNEGGNFLAQCAGIDLYENHQPLGGHFQSTNGVSFSANVTNTDGNPDMAYSQYQGVVTHTVGTIAAYWPSTSSSYKAQTYSTVASAGTNTYVASGAHIGNPDSSGYNVFYLGGHDYASTSAGTINGIRMYLNATLIPAGRPTAFPLVVTSPITICEGQSVTIGPSVCNSTATYQWGPATGLSSTSICNPVASPTTTSTYSVVGFSGGCIMGPTSMTVNVNPTPVMTSTNSATICGNNIVSIPLTSNLTSTYTWIAADNPNTTGESLTTQTTATLSNTIVNNTASVQTIIYTVTPTSTTGTCTGTPQTVTVTVNPAPSMTSASTATVCSGASLNIPLTSNIAGATFTWIASDNINTTGESLTSQSTATLSNTITNNTTTNQTVIYTVTPTAGGCLGNPQTVTVTVNPSPSLTITPTSQSLCSGSTSTVTLASNVAGTTYSWTVAQTGVSGASASSGTVISQALSATGVSAGTADYTITPTANGCSGTPQNVVVTVNPIPSATATPSSQALCSGATSTVALTGNVSGTTFAWTVTQTNISGASAGSGTTISQALNATTTSAGTAVYTITPTANSCSGSPVTTTVTVNPTPTVTATPTTQSICSNNTTTVSLSSGVAGTTFSWTVTQTNVTGASASSGTSIAQTLTATTASAGTAVYTITPTASSCPGSPVTVTVTVNPAPSMTATPTTQSLCSGNATSIALSSTTGGATFAWTVTQTNVSGASASTGSAITQTLTATGTSNGTAVYTITPTSGGCAGTPVTATVTVKPTPTVTATPTTQSICSNNTTTVSLSSGVAGTTFAWTVTQTNVTGASASSGTTIAQTLTATTASAGTAVYTITPTASSCPGLPVTATVTVNPAPTVTASPSTQSVCSAATTTVALSSSTAGATFAWTVTQTNVTGATAGSGTVISQALNATTTSAGTAVYTITPTAGGCAGTPITVTVTVNPTPLATATPSSQTICSANTTTVNLTSGVAGTTFAWTVTQTNVSGATASTGTVISQALSAATTSAGTAVYTITPTSGTGCAGSPITATVTVNPIPSATATPSTQGICSANTTTVNLTSGVAGTTFAWTVTQTNVSGASASSGSSIAQTLTATTSSAGTAVYTITPTANSCSGTPITATVTVNPAPTVTATPASQQFCSGVSTSIALTSSTPGTTFAWTVTQTGVSGASASTGTNIAQALTATGGTPGTAVYTITPTASGCSGTPIVVTVTVDPIPVATATPNSQSLCSGNASSIALSSSVAGTNFAWTVTQTNVSGASASTGTTIAQTLTATTTNAGTAVYTITPSVGTCNGSAITATVTVNPAPSMTATPTTQSICSGNSSSIALTSSTTGAIFAWTVTQTNVSGASASTGTNIAQALSATTASAGTAVYTITPTAGGCAGTPVTATVTVNPIPSMTATPATQSICSGAATSVALTSNVAGTTFAWTVTQTNVSGASASTGTSIAQTLSSTTASPGTAVYTITPTASTCGGTTLTVTVTVNPLPTMTATPTSQSICSGGSGSVALTSSTGGTTFAWTVTQTNVSGASASTGTNIAQALTNTTTSAGTAVYTITPTANSCNGAVKTVTVTVNPIPSMTSASTATICSGGTVSIPLTSNVASTYTWIAANNPNTSGESTTAQTTSTISNTITSSTGNTEVVVYTVTPASTSGSCVGSSQTVSVTISPTPIVTVTPNSQTLCGGSVTSLSLTSNVTGTTFTWTVTQTGVSGASSSSGSVISQTLSATGVVSGTAVYTISPTIGSCTGTSATATVTVNPIPSVTVTPSSQTICSGVATGIALTSNIAGTTYSWTVTQNNVSGASASSGSSITQTLTATSTTAGTATYTITPTANGCSGTPVVVTVTVNPTPVITATPSSQSICSGSAASVALTSNVTGTTYSWTIAQSGASGASNGSGSTITQTLTSTGASPGTVTYTITSSASACGGSPIVATVTVNPIPAAPSASSNSPVCLSNPINLTAGNVTGATYNWSGPNSFTSSVQNPTIASSTAADAGTYSVSVTVNGCTGPVKTVTVTINPPPSGTLTPGSNSPVCSGQTLTLTIGAIPSASYSWSGPNSFTSSVQNPTISNITVAGAGTYTLTATVPGCGTSGTGTVDVVVNPTPLAPTAGNNGPLCVGDNLNLTATNTGTTYSWTGPASFTASTQNPTLSNVTLANAGVYSVTATSLGCTGPKGTTTVVINPIPATPTVTANSPLCVGATLTMTTSAVAGATYNWSGPNSFTASTQNTSVSNVTSSNAGTYSLSVTVNGCTSPAGTVNVAVNTPPPAPFAGSNSPVCTGDSLLLNATSAGAVSFSWSGPNSFTSSLQNPFITPVTAAAAGTYTVISNNGCASTAATVVVTVNSKPAMPFAGSNSPLCEGATLNLTATNTGSTYSWSGPNGFTASTQNASVTNITLAGAGVYSVTATANGCTSNSGTVNVIVNPIPSPPTAGNNSPVCTGQAINLTASTISGATYSWTGPNSYTSNIQNPVIASAALTNDGTYSVSVTVSGCTSSLQGTTTVTVNPTPVAPVAGNNGPLCAGDNLNLTATGTGTTYSWSGPSSYTANTQNTSVSNVTAANAGVYSVTTTDNGCTSSAGTTTVVINAIPATPTVSSNSPLCITQTLSLTTSAVSGATYGWNGPNSFTASTQNATVSNVSAADAGTYSLTITVNGCTSAAGTVAVAVNSSPASPIAGSNSPVCTGDSVLLTASNIGGATYTWSGPNSFTSTSQNPLITPATLAASGTYTVIANNGCASTPATVSVIVNQTPTTPTVSSNSPLCEGGTLNLSSGLSAGATYNWSGPNSFTASTQNASVTNVTVADAGTYSLSVTKNGCTSPVATTTVLIQSPAIAAASPSQTVCANNPSVVISGTVTGGSTTGIWSTAGTGTFTPSATALTATYTPSNADTASGSVTITLTSTGNGACVASTSTLIVTITDAPGANAGSNMSVCGNSGSFNLNGVVSGAATGGTWTTSGTGTFSPDANTLNATYTPSAADTSSGMITFTLTTTGSGMCATASSSMTVTITNAPTANAGPDQIKCKGAPNAVLNGAVSVTNAGTWSTLGSGSFTPNANTLNATYVPGGSDITAGTVLLVLTSANNGGCTPVTDTMKITYTDIPVTDAGPDQTVCANNATITLNGSVTVGSTTGIWSTSGTGTFTPNNTTLNANYIPSSADTAAGTVTFTLTSTGGCVNVTDNLTVTITDAPDVTAGPDKTVCATNAVVTLSGSFSGGATGATWTTTGSGTFSPDNTTMNATYTPSGADTASGSVLIILTSANAANCSQDIDTLKINYTRPPAVLATGNATVCANNSAPLTGVISGGAGTGIWTTPNGSGTFAPGNTTLNASYNAVSADTAQANILLILTSTNNGGCAPASDTVYVTVNPGPVVSAGADQLICSNNTTATLNGAVLNATGGQWTTAGTGTFTPDNTTLNATYTPSAADVSGGSVTIILASTGNGLCQPASDTMKITFTPAPIVNAGNDTTICNNTASITLHGSVTGGASSGHWSTSGNGTFSPNDSTLNASYNLGTADTSGTIMLVLASSNNGGCVAVTDTMKINLNSAPVVFAGNDTTVCGNSGAISLNGSVNGVAVAHWSTSGTGTFTPNDSTLNGTYTPGASDAGSGSVMIYLTSGSNGTCPSAKDSLKVTFTPSPFVNAGLNIPVCGGLMTANLNGSVSGSSTTGQWTTLGSGTFSPNDSTLNATYNLTTADTTAGSVTLVLTSTHNGGCPASTDTVIIVLNAPPVTNAGNDTAVCASVASIQLNGAVAGGSGAGQWTSSGTGTFTPNDSTLNATYTFSSTDLASGTITLTLGSINNGNCGQSIDSIHVAINPLPVVNAGTNITLCGSSLIANLNGSVSGGTTTGQWSTLGTGTFAPNDSTLNGTYNLSTADSTAGIVTLVLTSTHNGSCSAVTDTVLVTLNSFASTSVGNDTAVCASVGSIQLNGVITGGSPTGQWTSSGTGTFAPNDSTLNATYSPGATDITNGNVTLVLTSTHNCVNTSDTMKISFNAVPVVNAGTDISVCSGSLTAQLNGSVIGGSTTGIWSTLGSGTFSPNDSTLNATYNLSTADSTAGSVTLVLTSTHNGSCATVTDTVKISTNAFAVTSAGNDTAVCGSVASIQLNGTVTGGSPTGQWTTSGSGSFTPNDSTLNASYVPGATDISNGSVTLVLTSTHNCSNTSDTMKIAFDSVRVVNAGTDKVVCPSGSISLNGSVSSGVAHWSASGTGTFTPNDSTMNATYAPALTDNDTLVFILTANGSSSCGVSKDTMMVIRGGQPNASFFANSACLGQAVSFADSSNGATITSWYWNFGNGDTSTTQNPVYTYTANGTYSVSLVVSSGASCKDSIIKVVNVNPAPSVSFTFSANCLSDSVKFTNTSTVATGNLTGWSWTFGDGGTSSQQNPHHLYDSIANYTVSLTVLSDSGCSASMIDTVNINASPLAGFTALTKCGLQASFTDTSKINSGTITNYNWTFGDGGTSTSQNPSYTYTATGTYTVTLQVQSNNGCTDTATQVVSAASPVVADFTPHGGTYNANQSISFTNQSTGATTYAWNFGDSNTSTATDPSHTYNTAGSYTVVLTASNATGCADTVAYEFTIKPSGHTIPTGFSPNGDGLNDYFYVMGGPFSSYELRVFNEWGQQIFMSTSQADKWDGTYQGYIQPSGTYIYVFNGKIVDGETLKLTGQVNITR